MKLQKKKILNLIALAPHDIAAVESSNAIRTDDSIPIQDIVAAEVPRQYRDVIFPIPIPARRLHPGKPSIESHTVFKEKSIPTGCRVDRKAIHPLDNPRRVFK